MIFDKILHFKKAADVLGLLALEKAESRLIGGCVRDALNNIAIKDIDIATTLLPFEVQNIFQKAGYKTLNVGEKFGTIVVFIDKNPYEITTLRKDLETDGRRATVVKYTRDWKEDALRRDFTINAMSYCPIEQKLYDYFGGQEDLKNRKIKFVGNPRTRVEEDFLRILRFFRFYAYFGDHSSIDHQSLEACIYYADKIKALSGERKYSEFYKILLPSNRVKTLELMGKANVLSSLFESDLDWAYLKVLERMSANAASYSFDIKPLLIIFVIASMNNIDIESLVQIFRLSGKDKKYLQCLERLTAEDLYSANLHKLIHEYGPTLLDSLLYLGCLHPTHDFIKVKAILDNDLPLFPLKGDDLIERFKLKPGKIIREMMESGRNFWCESEFMASKDQILLEIERRIKNANT